MEPKGSQYVNVEQQDMPARGRWARRAATMLVGGALAAGGLAAAAAPAHAAPSGCSYSTVTGTYGVKTYTVKCTEGDGQYRILLQCAAYQNGQWKNAYAYGQWATAGPSGSSSAKCPSGYGLFRYATQYA